MGRSVGHHKQHSTAALEIPKVCKYCVISGLYIPQHDRAEWGYLKHRIAWNDSLQHPKHWTVDNYEFMSELMGHIGD